MSTDERFTDNCDGTVTDHETGLMWTRTDTMNDMEKWVNYQDSTDYVRALNEKRFAGYEDWRVPAKEELPTLYKDSYSIKDKFDKDIHIHCSFAPGGGFSMIASLVSGRPTTWVFNIRDGEYSHPDGLWTLSEAARAVRSIPPE